MSKLQTYGIALLVGIVLWFGWLHLANNLREEGARMGKSAVRDSAAKAQQQSIAAYADSLKVARAARQRAEDSLAIRVKRSDAADAGVTADADKLATLAAKCNDPELTAQIASLTAKIQSQITDHVMERLKAADVLKASKEETRLAVADKDVAVALATTRKDQLKDEKMVSSKERRQKWIARVGLLLVTVIAVAK